MPSNKNQLLRLMKLDNMFRSGRYTMDELVERVSEFLEEKAGIESISERTLHNDIRFMREKFHAPVVVHQGRYYYADPDFDIFGDMTETEAEVLLEAADIMGRHLPLPFVEEFVHLAEDMILRTGMRTDYMFFPYVVMEEAGDYTGLKWIKDLYRAIEENGEVHIDYNSFDGSGDFEGRVRPYLLREFRNRWFLIGKVEGTEEPFYTIPLDRIQSVKRTKEHFYPGAEKEAILRMFDEIVGVTYIKENPVEEVELLFRRPAADYVRTKSIHRSQRVKETATGELSVVLRVRPNYELKQILLTYVPNVRVIRPKYLRESLIEMMEEGLRYMRGDDR